MSFENMPSHLETRQFGLQLARETDYDLIGESEESRVVLLSKLKKPISFEKT
jgi:wyosine [tRNA(Phe)-imidazoG37] synthetase (radical SAM superfamily)